nr:putative retrotransposon Gag domain-containing protein [Tanacetum cinerariifolium]
MLGLSPTAASASCTMKGCVLYGWEQRKKGVGHQAKDCRVTVNPNTQRAAIRNQQVKYATCTLQNSALTWWKSQKRTIGVDVAYAMKWAELMKLMTEVYCPRNEVQKS